MGIFGKFKKQQQSHELSEEEQEQLTSMMDSPSPSQDSTFEIIEYIKSITTLHEINKLRNILDKQEETLTGVHPVDKEENFSNQSKFTIEEETQPHQEISQVETQPLEENETYESSDPQKHEFEIEKVDDYKTIEDDYAEPTEEIQETKDEFSIQKELFLDKLKDLFGEDNFFVNIEEKSEIESLKGKKILHIGLRQKYAFGLDTTTPQEENKWFISTIKQLDDLKNFKMLRSEEGIKDLVWDRGDFAILLSFRSTNLLNSVNEFDFDL